jgi:hypothetical protein
MFIGTNLIDFEIGGQKHLPFVNVVEICNGYICILPLFNLNHNFSSPKFKIPNFYSLKFLQALNRDDEYVVALCIIIAENKLKHKVHLQPPFLMNAKVLVYKKMCYLPLYYLIYHCILLTVFKVYVQFSIVVIPISRDRR